MDAVERGRFLRRARRRRGLSQAVLAGLVGRSESWLSQVERGLREVDSHRVLSALAEVLRVDIAELTGEGPGDEAGSRYSATRAIERAMLRYGHGDTLIGGDAPQVDLAAVRRDAARAYAAYQATRYEEVGRRLPRLIREVEAAAQGRGVDRPTVCSVRALVYNTAAAVLRRVGERELAWQAADRAMSAAEWADDPLLGAVGAYRLAYVLISRKRPGEALELASSAAQVLQKRKLGEAPGLLSVYGGLYLAAATAAAAVFDSAGVARALGEAERAAGRLGKDMNVHGTAFGPTNVALHQVSTAVALGDARTAVRVGEELDVEALAVGLVGRRTQVRLDLARAFTQRRMDAAAVTTLLEAEELSPELVRYDVQTAAVLGELLKREHRRSTPQLRGLAQRAGVA